eukprot:4984028-Alexandrium_andersonii.AAC.1
MSWRAREPSLKYTSERTRAHERGPAPGQPRARQRHPSPRPAEGRISRSTARGGCCWQAPPRHCRL